MQRVLWKARDERGVALLTAVMISAIVFIMGATAVQMAVHNSDASGRDRRRVEAIGAAEAGLDWYFSHLQIVDPGAVECSVNRSLTGSPPTEFTVTGEFFDAAGDPLPCPLTTIPDSVLITSAGQTSAVEPVRAMQSFVYLAPKPPSAFGESAVFSDIDPGLNSETNVFDSGSVNADLYTNGNVLLNNNVVVYGSVLAQGFIQMNGNSEVRRDVWAGDYVDMQGDSVVRGNVTSSTFSITLSANPHIYGDAQAGTTITAGPTSIDGLRIDHSPSDPPPHRPFPVFTFDAAAWDAAGYTVTTFSDCAEARSFIENISSGDHAVRITDGSCVLQWTASQTVTIRGDLAIISDGGLRMDSRAKFESDGSPHTLHLMFGLDGTDPCDIEFHGRSDVGDDLMTLIYTPCRVLMNSRAFVGQGQILGGQVVFNASTSLTYSQINVPGMSPGGFDEKIAYIREVIPD